MIWGLFTVRLEHVPKSLSLQPLRVPHLVNATTVICVASAKFGRRLNMRKKAAVSSMATSSASVSAAAPC